MKKYIIPFIYIIFLFTSCQTNTANQEDQHAHHDHDHDHNHDHDHEHDHDHDHDHSDEQENDHSDEIVFTEEQAKAAGLQTQVISTGPFHYVIKTSGQIQPAQGDEQTIVASSNGIVSFNNSSISEGTAVRAGDALFSISSKNLLEGDPNTKARIAYETAAKEFQRAQALVADKIISDKEFQSIRSAYEIAKTSYEAQSGNITTKGVQVKNPISGFLKSRLVNQGEYVTVGQPLAVISQNKKLQLRADLSERHYKSLKGISTANFKTAYDSTIYQLSQLNGRLLSFGKSSNTSSAYLPIIFEFDNRADLLPGAYLDVYLLSTPITDALTIPLTAVTEEQGLYFVYLRIGKEAFKKQEVQLGQTDGKRVQVKQGLEKGQEIVSVGAYQVKIAANSSLIPEGHTH